MINRKENQIQLERVQPVADLFMYYYRENHTLEDSLEQTKDWVVKYRPDLLDDWPVIRKIIVICIRNDSAERAKFKVFKFFTAAIKLIVETLPYIGCIIGWEIGKYLF